MIGSGASGQLSSTLCLQSGLPSRLGRLDAAGLECLQDHRLVVDAADVHLDLHHGRVGADRVQVLRDGAAEASLAMGGPAQGSGDAHPEGLSGSLEGPVRLLG